MHRCTTACFNHTHRQGAGCLCDTNASRAALGLAPLHQKDGGHSFNGGLAFPIQPEEDEPVFSLANVEPAIWAVIVVSAVAIVIGLARALWWIWPVVN